MFDIKKVFGIRTKAEKIAEYRSLRKSLAEYNVKGQELAEEFALQKSAVMNLCGVPKEKQQEIIKSYGEFLKSHNEIVTNTMNERNKVIKSMESLRSGSCGETLRKIDSFYSYKEAYQEGRIEKSVYFSLMKALGGGKVRYSDIVVFNDTTGKILILHRTDDNLCPNGEVCIPGGHVDPGETFEQAALRELKEETNLDPMKENGIQELGVYEDSDIEIHYYRVIADHNQPVVCEGCENCWAEWISPGEIFLKPFIFDQGENVSKLLTEPCMNNVQPIMDLYAEHRMDSDAMVEGVSAEICKACGVDYNPLMPESLEGGKKTVKVSTRDPFYCLEHVCKSISGESNFSICGHDIAFEEPIFVHETSYNQDPSKGRLCEFSLVFSGNNDNIKKLFECLSRFGTDIKMELKTPNEEFMSVNDNGIDYVGEPVFVE